MEKILKKKILIIYWMICVFYIYKYIYPIKDEEKR